MSVNIESAAMYRIAQNGNVVDEGALNAVYDGNTLDVKGFQNDESIYMRLDNNDLMKLLATPASNQSLEQRLLTDFSDSPRKTPYKSKSRTKSKTKSKTNSKTKSKTKSKTPRIHTISPRHTIKPAPLYVDNVASGIKRKKHTKKRQHLKRKTRRQY
jgi:hypothetical protein